MSLGAPALVAPLPGEVEGGAQFQRPRPLPARDFEGGAVACLARLRIGSLPRQLSQTRAFEAQPFRVPAAPPALLREAHRLLDQPERSRPVAGGKAGLRQQRLVVGLE